MQSSNSQIWQVQDATSHGVVPTSILPISAYPLSILGYAMHLQPWNTCMLMASILSFDCSELLAIFVGSETYKGSIHPAHWLVSTFMWAVTKTLVISCI